MRRTRTNLWAAGSLGALLLLLATPPATAGTLTSTSYRCTVSISPFSFHDCMDGIIAVTASSGNQRLLQVDLDRAHTWHSLTIVTNICDPTGWTVNIGDSPTNNGGGGDSGSTSHDAEAELNGTSLNVFYSDVGGTGLHTQLTGAVPASGCTTSQWTVIEDGLSYDNDGNTADAPLVSARGRGGSPTHLFDFPPYNETDSEDSFGVWADDLFVGLNRVVDGNSAGSRNGTGLESACFFLSTSANPGPSAISSACGL